VDWLIAVQGEARFFLVGAQEAGMASERLHCFSSPGEAADFCRTLLQPGDVVLVKGSRGVHLEKVIADLQSPPSDKQAPGPAVPRN
jgi:UDP-N-acetylmuramoyl-tripeptide--D-alanyl-D-alanine ligase